MSRELDQELDARDVAREAFQDLGGSFRSVEREYEETTGDDLWDVDIGELDGADLSLRQLGDFLEERPTNTYDPSSYSTRAS